MKNNITEKDKQYLRHLLEETVHTKGKPSQTLENLRKGSFEWFYTHNYDDLHFTLPKLGFFETMEFIRVLELAHTHLNYRPHRGARGNKTRIDDREFRESMGRDPYYILKLIDMYPGALEFHHTRRLGVVLKVGAIIGNVLILEINNSTESALVQPHDSVLPIEVTWTYLVCLAEEYDAKARRNY